MEFRQSKKEVTTRLGHFIFVWGEVQAVHHLPGSEDIAYLVVEYLSNPSFIAREGKVGGAGKLCFHPYIIQSDGVFNDTNHSYGSIEEAIVAAIALRFDGLNTQAASFFMKVVGAETAKEWLPMSERYPHLQEKNTQSKIDEAVKAGKLGELPSEVTADATDLDKEPSHFIVGENGKDWACESLNSSGGG